MAKKVLIESWVWDAICAHYAQMAEPSEDDRRVIAYMMDKLGRQIAHEAYERRPYDRQED